MAKWRDDHAEAMLRPNYIEKPIVNLFNGLASYATIHFETYETPLGEDRILGPAWAEAVRAFRVLLNGQTGRIDCGKLDGWAVDALKMEAMSR